MIKKTDISKNPIGSYMGINTLNLIDRYFIFPKDSDNFLDYLLKNTKKTLLFCIYEFCYNDKVIETFDKLLKNKIEIKIILDRSVLKSKDHFFAEKSKTKRENLIKILTKLKSSNLTLIYSNPSYCLNHSKYIIIDSKQLVILSKNFDESFDSNVTFDVGVIASQKDCVEEAIKTWNSDFNYEVTFNEVPSSGPLMWSSGDVIENIVYKDPNKGLPKGNFYENYIKAICFTKKSLYVICQELSDPVIISLLITKALEGIEVNVFASVIVNLKNFKKQYNIQDLKNFKITNNILDKRLYIHAKCTIFDGTMAILGSTNLTNMSMFSNRELSVAITDENFIKDCLSYCTNTKILKENHEFNDKIDFEQRPVPKLTKNITVEDLEQGQ